MFRFLRTDDACLVSVHAAVWHYDVPSNDLLRVIMFTDHDTKQAHYGILPLRRFGKVYHIDKLNNVDTTTHQEVHGSRNRASCDAYPIS